MLFTAIIAKKHFLISSFTALSAMRRSMRSAARRIKLRLPELTP